MSDTRQVKTKIKIDARINESSMISLKNPRSPPRMGDAITSFDTGASLIGVGLPKTTTNENALSFVSDSHNFMRGALRNDQLSPSSGVNSGRVYRK